MLQDLLATVIEDQQFAILAVVQAVIVVPVLLEMTLRVLPVTATLSAEPVE